MEQIAIDRSGIREAYTPIRPHVRRTPAVDVSGAVAVVVSGGNTTAVDFDRPAPAV